MSGAFVALFLATRKTNGSPSADQGLLQPGTTAAMLCYLKGDSHAPLPIPIFLLVENLSSKWLHQLITCGKSQIFKSSVIKGLIKIGTDEDEKLAVNFA